MKNKTIVDKSLINKTIQIIGVSIIVNWIYAQIEPQTQTHSGKLFLFSVGWKNTEVLLKAKYKARNFSDIEHQNKW